MRLLLLLPVLAFALPASADPVLCVTHDSAVLAARACDTPENPTGVAVRCSSVVTGSSLPPSVTQWCYSRPF